MADPRTVLTGHVSVNLIPSSKDNTPYARAFRLVKIEGDSERVQALLEQGCAAGDPRAIYSIATWYLFGVRRRKNFRKAAELLKTAATSAISRAAYDLAVSYETGKGIPQNARAAFNLYVASLACGDKDAAEEVARCLYWGIGVPKDRYAAAIIYKAFEETKAASTKKKPVKMSTRLSSSKAPSKTRKAVKTSGRAGRPRP